MIFFTNPQKKEIKKISKEYNIPHEQKKILLEICKEIEFSPVQINNDAKKSSDLYIYSDKIYKGLLNNIFTGECCKSAYKRN